MTRPCPKYHIDQSIDHSTPLDSILASEESGYPLCITTQSLNPQPIFHNDQEVFFDLSSTLLMVTDMNNHTMSNSASDHKLLVGLKLKNEPTEENTPIERKNPRKLKHQVSFATLDNEDTKAPILDESTPAKSQRPSRPSLTIESRRRYSRPAAMIVESREEIEEVDVFQDKKEEEVVVKSKLKPKLMAILDSRTLDIVMAVFTIYVLFANDVRVLAFSKPADIVFDVFSMIAMGIFIGEIILNLILRKEYKWSFFFWLDVISTASILMDIQLFEGILPTGNEDTAQLARTSRASRIGTRASRVVRILRLFRLAKLFKQVKKKSSLTEGSTENKKGKQEGFDSISNENNPKSNSITTRIRKVQLFKSLKSKKYKGKSKPTEKKPVEKITSIFSKEEEDSKQSRVGKKLVDLTTKRVIVIVLALLLLCPLFTADFFFDPPASFDYDTALLASVIDNSSISQAAKTNLINNFIQNQMNANPVLIYMDINGTIIFQGEALDTELLRDDEFESIVLYTVTLGPLTIINSSKEEVNIRAELDIGRTFFIICLLIFGAMLFNKDANELVLRPLERIIQKVNRIAQNPLLAKEQELIKESNIGFKNEAIEIENAIIKIGSLLALGFGDAGSTIIAKNMTQSGDLNPMLPGKKMMGIFGFCDIRNFTDVTEVLQEDVMVFVNSIADIVHSIVDKYTGAANKNIGDAFLLVWKFPEAVQIKSDDGEIGLLESNLVQNITDYALISFFKILSRINRDPTLINYRQHPGLKARLPNYKVKMGFGLHIGWAIEGAIGSEFKIDASYLSPNVNMASRLEAATKQYGVPLLYSGDLYHRLSKNLRKRSRLIDVVTVKGSVKPIELYTADIDADGFGVSEDRTTISKSKRQKEHKEEKTVFGGLIYKENVSELLNSDEELRYLFRNDNSEFNDVFEDGFKSYIAGNWAVSKRYFDRCLEMRPEDGPTRNLLNFMMEHDYIAPEQWQGCHVLTEK